MVGNSQIDQWLLQHGLQQYTDVFKANDVSLRALAYLNDDDLRELGVSLGHRRILLTEINRLHDDDASSSHQAVPPAQAEDAERRQLTVMFCDVVGSTSISHQIDPEEMREILRNYQNTVSSAVRQYQGYVARFIGDGVLSYFGWPKAYEDQAERAIRSSIEVVAKIKSLKSVNHEPIQVRIGIDSGLVVVGDLIGEATSDLNTVTGDTPNLASRLQGLAKPGEIVIGPNTHKLLGTTFELKDLGPQTLKGYNEKVPAWSVVAARETESRFEAARGKTLANLVGREHELGMLKERWQLTKHGEGQIVLLSGEAGIGKSRLASDFRLAISRDLCFKLSYQCSPHHTNSAFYPIIQRLQRAVGYTQNDSTDEKLDKLEKSLKVWGSDTKKVAPLFAELMSVSGERRYGNMELTPQQLRQRTIEAMIEQILALSRRRSVYVLIEDAHWIDPSMMDFVSELMHSITDRPVMLLITYRPEESLNWTNKSTFTSISLDRLGRKHAAEIANSVGGKELMDAMIEKIVIRADGVPLYIEELTKSVVESFSTDEHILTDAVIPPTLQSSLVARLDRLEHAKETAQIGAVIGREFSYEMLSQIHSKTEAEINTSLDKLLESGLVFKRGIPPNELYTFKHALVQDAAYDTILISKRRRLHALIVDALEAQADESTNDKTDLLAHHSFQGELCQKAFVYLQVAGQKAMDRAAVHEAVALFEKALIAGSHLPKNEQSIKKDIDLRFDLRNALWSIGEFEKILATLNEAEHLAEKLDDPTRTGWISVFSSASLWQLGRASEAMAAANHAIEINAKNNDLSLKIGSKFYFGCATVTSGDCHTAITIFGQICKELGGDRDYDRCGLPFLPAVIARSWIVWAHAERGEFDQAHQIANKAMEIAIHVGHPFNIAHINYDLGYLYYIQGDYDLAVEALEKANEIITEWGLTYLSPFISGFLGHAYTLSGDTAKALSLLQNALVAYENIGLGLFRSLVNVYMGKALLMDEQTGRALSQTNKALALAKSRNERGHQAYALFQLGEIAFHPDFSDLELAEKHFTEAMTIAEQLEMRPLLADCYKQLSNIFRDKNNLSQSFHYVSMSNRLFKQLDMKNVSTD